MTKQELLNKLPKDRTYWYIHEVAPLIGSNAAALKKRSERNDIGKVVKRKGGGRGIRVYRICDLDQILNVNSSK